MPTTPTFTPVSTHSHFFSDILIFNFCQQSDAIKMKQGVESKASSFFLFCSIANKVKLIRSSFSPASEVIETRCCAKACEHVASRHKNHFVFGGVG